MEVKQTFFSGACYFCQSKTDYTWCRDCERDFIQKTSRCPVCARFNQHANVCGNCLKNPPPFISTETLFNYVYPTNHLIKPFKFSNRPELANVFAEKLASILKLKRVMLPEFLVPVPLHRKRQRERGYNQSSQFAQQLGKQLGLTVNSSLCSRIKNTHPQSTLPMKTRRKNVKGAFCLNSNQVPKHIAIVDDVMTTGSTINEVAGLFSKAGCQRIDVWVIARA